MKHHTLLFIFLTSFSLLQAQTDSSYRYDRNKSLLLYIGLGAAYNNYKNLNSTFEDAGLPTIGKFSFINSIEADIRHKNLLLGLSGNFGFSYRRPDEYNILLLNIGPQVNVGYYVYNNQRLHIAPQAGIGFLSSVATLSQRKNIDNFNELLAEKNSININQMAPVLDFCLRFDIADFTKPKTTVGSIKLGYKYGLSKKGWGIDPTNNSTIANSPEDRINQFYVMLLLGASLLKPQHMMK